MAYEVSRRSFLKGAAALAIATAASGLLTGCGGKDNSGMAIGDYRVNSGAMDYYGPNSSGQYVVETTFKIKATKTNWVQAFKNLFKDKKYSSVFSADCMNLLNGDVVFDSMAFKDDEVTCTPKFYTMQKDVYDKLVSGEEKLKLTITLGNSSRVFDVDVKNKVITAKV